MVYGVIKMFWFNMGILCNIECVNCFIESLLMNDCLVYFIMVDVLLYLDELEEVGEMGIEIGFIGGELFMVL